MPATATATRTATATTTATVGAPPPTGVPAAGYALDLRAAEGDAARTGFIPGTAGPETVEAWLNPRTIGYSMILVNSDNVVG